MHRPPSEFNKAGNDDGNSAIYTAGIPFGIGVVHGFGAETGTQVLLLAAIGGSTNSVMAISLLCSFIVGLLISNTLVAVIASAGFLSSAKFKPALMTISTLTGVFSLIVGTVFVTGNVACMPDLKL